MADELVPQLARIYHVFIASPSDVNVERHAVRIFFDRFNRRLGQLWGIRFEVVDWENYSSIGVGRPQSLITEQTLEKFRGSLAVVIGIMAQRFGSRTGAAESGTEEELEWALAKNREFGFPEVKWYFRKVDSFTAPPDPNAVTAALEQWVKVCAFRAKIETSRDLLFGEYPDAATFSEYFDSDMSQWLMHPSRPWVPAISTAALRKASISPPMEYFENLERDFRRLDISGIDNERAFEIPLSDIYVRLRVMFDEDPRLNVEKPDDTGPIDVQTALIHYNRLAIVGDPGSGKSTFLKFVALMLSRAFLLNNPGIALDKLCLIEPLPFPIFLSCWELGAFLRDKDESQLSELIIFISGRLRIAGFDASTDEVRVLLRSGNCCLMFDGLDEVATDSGRAIVSRLLEACVKEFPENRFIVTARIRAYTGDTILKGDFTRCDIQPFDATDRAEFLRNWVALLFKVSPEEVCNEGSESNRELSGLIRGIEGNDRIRPLAVNPLLLTVIAIVHWNRKRLPEQRVDLYDECVDVLLGQKKDAERIQLGRQSGAFDEGIELDQFEERAWIKKRFAEIAVHILVGDKNHNETTRIELVKLLEPRFRDRGATTPELAQTRALLFLERQELRSGLLVSRREQSYRFVHLTFQEYLAAWNLANQDFENVIEVVGPNLRHQRWFETLQLLGAEWAKQSDEKLRRYVDWLLAIQGTSIGERAPIIALCANIVRDAAGVAELGEMTYQSFQAGVKGTLDAFRPGSGIPAFVQLEILEALGRLGSAVKPHLISASKSGLYPVRRRAIELLLPHLPEDDLFSMTHILSDRSKEPIKTYLSSLFMTNLNRAVLLLTTIDKFGERCTEAFSQVGWRVRDHMSRDDFKAMVRNVFNRGSSMSPAYNFAARSILLGWINLDSSELIQIANSDREEGVRARAIALLVERFPENADLLGVALQYTLSGGSAVRSESLRALAAIAPNSTETRDAIARSAADPRFLVRHAAISVVGSRAEMEPWMKPILLNGMKDSEAFIKSVALNALLKFKPDEDILAFLGEVASSDASTINRQRAFGKLVDVVTSDPFLQRLLYQWNKPEGLGIDPLKVIDESRVESVAIWLDCPAEQVREGYNKLVSMLESTLRIKLLLSWV